MRISTVGNSGLRVSGLGLGTLSWGRGTPGDEAAAQLVAFVEAGGTLVDTSPAYSDGASEQVLAELMGDVMPREDLVISGSAGIAPAAPLGRRVDCSRRALLAQLDNTLTALGTDYLDVWQVATWDRQTPVAEIAATLDYAVRSGKVRYTGVRGHLGWQLATVAAATGASGASESSSMIATQAEYSLLAREVEDELIPAAQHHGIGLFAAVPLAGGVLTGKYRDGIPSDSRGADEFRGAMIQAYLGTDSLRVIEAVVTAADGLGTSPLAVALAWVRDRPGVASAIVGTRDLAQLTGALAAAEITLPPAITAALDDVSST
ncbi:aldo/keto reductase [Tomitella biformata]|uniref:aldo/keto reductase n=1 Tax=Tomitella biformata TaxID=630403 RepID=UPI000465D227|nr:aldo/keto reductase [Tomitella biformata]